jgi:predicted nucleotidyltransferase
MIDFAFLEKDENVLAVLLFGSGAKGQLNNRSDRDICVVAPAIRDTGEMRSLLKRIYVNLDVVGKRYDVWLFEELLLYMKLQVIENHEIVFCRDLPELYEYFYFYRKI